MLQAQAADFSTETVLAFPQRKHLAAADEEKRINLAQFYQLADCPIQAVIAERNTTLGKLHSPSRRYLYQVNFIQTLELCPSLPEEVQDWLALKKQQLPQSWARLIMLTDELKQQLSAQAGFIDGSDSDGLNQVSQALSYLLQLQTQPSHDSQQLELQLQALLNYPLLSQMWRSQQLLAHNLSTTSKWLKEHNPAQHCEAGKKPPQQIEFLSNVFRLFFIQKIQPVSSRLNYYHYQLQPKLQQLLQSPGLTPEFKTYVQAQYQQGFATYQTQMQQHVQQWQQLFKQCQVNFTANF